MSNRAAAYVTMTLIYSHATGYSNQGDGILLAQRLSHGFKPPDRSIELPLKLPKKLLGARAILFETIHLDTLYTHPPILRTTKHQNIS